MGVYHDSFNRARGSRRSGASINNDIFMVFGCPNVLDRISYLELVEAFEAEAYAPFMVQEYED